LAELTHHDTDDGFHEIQLSGKQLVFLFMLASSLAVAIFLCGVQVGRKVPTDRVSVTDATDPITTAAADPAPASTPSQPVASSGPPAAEPPAPADDNLSYAKRLPAEAPPAETLKTPTDTPAPKPPQVAKVQESSKPQEAPKPQDAPKPQQPTKSAEAAKAAPAAVASTGRAGQWIVQVISLQDRGAAAGIAKRLSGKGYPAFVLDPSPGAPRIYRVQVGGFPDKNDAEQAARRLEKDEQMKPLVRSR
jgi:cell division septation protein DedD